MEEIGTLQHQHRPHTQELFHVPHAEATAKLQTAKALMERWFAAYMEVGQSPLSL